MPIHVYECDACACRFEALVRGDREPSACTECGSSEIERMISPFAITRREVDQIRDLDPKYKQMVDDLIASTPEAEPMRHLERLTSFDEVDDPGDPIEF